MARCLARFVKDDAGSTAMEYAMIAAFLAIAIIATVTAIGSGLNDKLAKVNDGFQADE